jgi:hypothetical protein
MSNKLYIGFKKNIELPKSKCLLIDDEVPTLPDKRRPLYFDPLKHSFNPLKNLDYRKAREIADILYTVTPQGENTLTMRDGKRALLKMLLEGDARFDRLPEPGKKDVGGVEAQNMIADMLRSPVLSRVLCEPVNFSFKPGSVILARVNRAELGDFDALVLGLLLMAHFKGQVVVPDFGFYGREAHVSLIRQRRLIAGVNVLAELSPKLRQNVLLIDEKVASGATAEDAEVIAIYEGKVPGTTGFNDFVKTAME